MPEVREWSDEEINRLLLEIEAIVRASSEIILAADDQAERSSYKSNLKDLVTEYDVRVQVYLEEHLRRLLPEAGFLGEEDGVRDIEGKSVFFIVDPIDGTSNFVADYRHSGISVALVGRQASGTIEPVLGLIYNPYLDEIFTAGRGCGAYLNGQAISVADAELADSLVLFGTSPYQRKFAAQTFDVVEELFLMSRDIRRGGAAVLDISYVACGRAALFFEIQLSPWDYAAAACIVAEAGGVITDLYGQALSYLEPSGIVAGPGRHHETCLEILRRMNF